MSWFLGGHKRPFMLYSVAQQIGAAMRISDRVLKCTVFLGVLKGDDFVPLGTGFLVNVREEEYSFQYLVTCQHNVIQAGTRPLYVRINRKSGESDVMGEIPPDAWIYHPDSQNRFVDVAALPVSFPRDLYDVVFVKDEDFWSREKIAERDIGVGEELFYPGLFLHHSGTLNNLPVMRTGTLAAMPIEPVQTKRGPMLAYLMESRSIGGHSGSPVFGNLLAHRTYYADKKVSLPHPNDFQAYPMLGVLRSYFKASDEGLSADEPGDDLSLNSGISVIIPSWEITDMLKSKKQTAIRRDANAKHRASLTAEVEASLPVAENPDHHRSKNYRPPFEDLPFGTKSVGQ